MDIIKKISEEIGCRTSQTEAAVKLIDEGNTIPFIARYRKKRQLAHSMTNSSGHFTSDLHT